MSVSNQVVIIYAAGKGYLDDINLDKVKEFETGLLEHFQTKYSDCLDKISQEGDISDDLEKAMNTGIEEFKKTF